MSLPISRKSQIVRAYPSMVLRPGVDSGITRLCEEPFVLGQTTILPDTQWIGGQATVSTWPVTSCSISQVSLSIAGSGAEITPNSPIPLLRNGLDGVKCNDGKYYFITGEEGNPSTTNKCLCVECYFHAPATSISALVAKNRTLYYGASLGWSIYSHTNGNLYFAIGDGTHGGYVSIFNGINNMWNYFLFVYKDNGNDTCIIYSSLNGARNTYYATFNCGDITAAASTLLVLQGQKTAGLLSIYKPEVSTLDADQLDTLSKERFLTLMSGIPLHSWNPSNPIISMTGSQPQTIDGTSYLMGAGAPRFDRVTMADGRKFVGLNNDRSGSNSYILSASNNIGMPEGAIRCNFYAPSTTTLTSSLFSINSGNDPNNHITAYVDVDGIVKLQSRKTGGQNCNIATAGDVRNNLEHTILVSYATNKIDMWLDGSRYSSTASIMLTASAICIGNDYANVNNSYPILIGTTSTYSEYINDFNNRNGVTII